MNNTTNTNNTNTNTPNTPKKRRYLPVMVQVFNHAQVQRMQAMQGIGRLPALQYETTLRADRVCRFARRHSLQAIHALYLRLQAQPEIERLEKQVREQVREQVRAKQAPRTPAPITHTNMAKAQQMREQMQADAQRQAQYMRTLQDSRGARRVQGTLLDMLQETAFKICAGNYARMGASADAQTLWNMRQDAAQMTATGRMNDSPVADMVLAMYTACAGKYVDAEGRTTLQAEAPCRRIMRTDNLPAGYTRMAWLQVRTDAGQTARIMLYACRRRGAGARPVHGLYSIGQKFIASNLSTVRGRYRLYSADESTETGAEVRQVRCGANPAAEAVRRVDAQRQRQGIHLFINRVAQNDKERNTLRMLSTGYTYRDIAQAQGRAVSAVYKTVARIKERCTAEDESLLRICAAE